MGGWVVGWVGSGGGGDGCNGAGNWVGAQCVCAHICVCMHACVRVSVSV